MHVHLPSGSLTLEGDLTAPAAAARGAVVCHPHPQYGGEMDNPMVLAVTGALSDCGYATLRFNFRGVGGSSGSYGGGVGEAEDLGAAIRYLVDSTAVRTVTLAGYSFGAMMVLQVGPTVAEVDHLIAVAPPLSFASLDPVATCTAAKLFVVGDRDQYCSVAQLNQQLARVVEPKRHVVIGGADHFFAGSTLAVAAAVRAFVQEA